MSFAAGDAVRVRDLWPEPRTSHERTPHYARGRRGVVVRPLGVFPDPGALAYARPAEPRALYHVLVEVPGFATDGVLIEIYEHWLEAA